MNKNKLMTFTVRFLVAAPAVFFLFVTQDLQLGYATVPVALVSCVLLVLLITFLEPRFQHIVRVRINSDRRIYINDVPYHRIVLATIGGLILYALLLSATGQLGSFVHDLFRTGH